MILEPKTKLRWIYTYYPITRLYRLLVYSLKLMQPFRIRMWKKFDVNWNLAVYEEED